MPFSKPKCQKQWLILIENFMGYNISFEGSMNFVFKRQFSHPSWTLPYANYDFFQNFPKCMKYMRCGRPVIAHNTLINPPKWLEKYIMRNICFGCFLFAVLTILRDTFAIHYPFCINYTSESCILDTFIRDWILLGTGGWLKRKREHILYLRVGERSNHAGFYYMGVGEEQPWGTLSLASHVMLIFPIYQLHLATKTKFLKINILYRYGFFSEDGPFIFNIDIPTVRFFPVSRSETKYCIILLDHSFRSYGNNIKV